MERVESESSGLFCPELTDSFEGRQASKALEPLGEVVGIEERRQMRAQAVVRVVVEPPNRCLLDGPVHSFDLAVGPRVIEFCQAMVDAELRAGQVEGMGAKGPSVTQQLPNFRDR